MCFSIVVSPAMPSRLNRILLSAFWVGAGANHFRSPRFYEAIVPRTIERWKHEIVVVSGLAELAGGVGVLPERTRRPARWGLLALLAAIYPANVQMALYPGRYPKIPPAALWARLPLQFLCAWWVWRATE
jgi:uncharacterized membrane protein